MTIASINHQSSIIKESIGALAQAAECHIDYVRGSRIAWVRQENRSMKNRRIVYPFQFPAPDTGFDCTERQIRGGPLDETRGANSCHPAAISPAALQGDFELLSRDRGRKRVENLVWYYPEPVHESERIKGLVCFHHELVDKILIDGIEIPKESTAASHGYF